MRSIPSSWNSDRIAASVSGRRPSSRTAPKPSALYAQYRSNSDTVTVFTRRGRKVYARSFGDTILSALIDGDDLSVKTVNGGRFLCDAATGELLESDIPAKPTSESPTPRDHLEPLSRADLIYAA